MSRPVCTLPGPSEAATAPERKDASLRGDFSETSETLNAAAAQALAGRCLASVACLYCEVCQLLCPDQCITRDPDSGHIQIDLDHCKGCGLCAHFCPKGAIQMVVEKQD